MTLTEWLTLKSEDAWDLLNVADQHQELWRHYVSLVGACFAVAT